MAKQTQITATLVRGSTYSLRNADGTFTRFSKNTPVEVTAEQQARLEADAQDWVTARHPDTDEPRGEHRQKFKFALA